MFSVCRAAAVRLGLDDLLPCTDCGNPFPDHLLHQLEILQGDLRGEHTRLYHLAKRGQGKPQYNNHYHRICFALQISDGSKYFSQIRIRYWQIDLRDRIVQRTLIPLSPLRSKSEVYVYPIIV